MSDSPNDWAYKFILTSSRRLEAATKSFSGRTNPKEIFVTSDQRHYMYEIVKTDPELLENTIRQFIRDVKSTENNVTNIAKLRDIFTEILIGAYVNSSGYSDEDEEWLSQSDSYYSPLSSPISSSSKSSSRQPKIQPKIEPRVENIWITKTNYSTKIPRDYENYLEGITFLGKYEIIRLLKPFGPIEPTNMLWNQISYGTAVHEFLHEECKKYYHNHPNYYSEMSKIINKNLSRVWTLSSKKFPPIGSRSHVMYSGDIVFKDDQLVLSLNPPKIGISKRYYRLFSSERFLHLKINMDMNSLDNNQRSRLKELLLRPLPLAGRIYKFLYGKSDTIYYFATSGSDLPNVISIREVLDYNLPLELNRDTTLAKFYSRISLGFSNSTPTIIFKPNEVYHVEDIECNKDYSFTDGCSAISIAAMKEVADVLGLEETPSALQGRIGGSKGIWYIEPRKDTTGAKWIELRKSQTKYNVTNNPHLRTLEVLSVVSPPKNPGTLNGQLIRVLLEGGVSVDIFLRIVKNFIEKAKSQVVGCDDPHILINWVTNITNVMKKRLEIFNQDTSDDGSGNGDISGFPTFPSEQCIQLLQAGFVPSTCPFLAKKLKAVLLLTLKSLFNKFRIEVPLSRVLLCIADPTETLEPGTVFIQLDKEAGRDERTGLPFGIIEDYVILARNPSTLPSDIMKVKAVKNIHLNMYYNVVVFPVKAEKGDIPLVAHLSGGDYDGDKIFCCWDPSIVKNFKNARLQPISSRVENAFIKNEMTLDKLLLSTRPDEIEARLQEVIIENYFKDLEPTLGLYDRWHRLQSSNYGLSDETSIYLAQMCAKLVDATKQGLTILPSVQQRDNEIFRKLPVPYWMDKDNKCRNRLENLGAMDYIYMEIEKYMKEISSKDFQVAKITQDPDPHINEFWNNEFDRARRMEGEEGLAYKNDLNLIYGSSSEIIKMYNTQYRNIFDDDQDRDREQSSKPANSKNEKFKGVDHEFLKRFLNNPPVEKYQSSIFKFLKGRGPLTLENIDPLTMFELQLKAAALYIASIKRKPAGQDCWVIAFRVLCNIKSQMIDKDVLGGPRSIIDDVWQSMKIDRKWIK
ncbi:RNA dependent RNA polymerase-domain-containing protein [Glomus cerebriforme]|uniref:RNA-dependent RNA polymerase n=1 Tax=Glomus cerebriforme TaxID=658196 RepID=A0A397TNZ6_9GLOM|nr:RNA dependent RNA polymerase-domain-containing protein [Glomus cerebriforme]